MQTKTKKTIKYTLLTLWIIVITYAVWFYIHSGMGVSEYTMFLQEQLRALGWIGPIAYMLIYTIRPLVFFPATILTALSGVLFGPVWGIIYTMIGENMSANFSFLVGRYFGKSFVDNQANKHPLLHRFEDELKDNGFISVLIMRLIFLPFDLVGYFCGMTPMKQRDYALGTFFGIIPGLITFVLLGASFSDPRNLLLSGFFFVLGLVISKVIKRRKKLS